MFDRKKYYLQHKEQNKRNQRNRRNRIKITKTHIYNLYTTGQLIKKSDIHKKYISKEQLIHIIKNLQQQEAQHYQSLYQLLHQLIQHQQDQSNKLFFQHQRQQGQQIINHGQAILGGYNHPYPSTPSYPSSSDSDLGNLIKDMDKSIPTLNSKQGIKNALSYFKGNSKISKAGQIIINSYAKSTKLSIKRVHNMIKFLINTNKNSNSDSFSNTQWRILIQYLNQFKSNCPILKKHWNKIINSRTARKRQQISNSQQELLKNLNKETKGLSKRDME